jgi:protein phosphatase
MGSFLECENTGLKEPLKGTADPKHSPAFAVFDGMGGEQNGEVAAYIAATTFDASYQEHPKAPAAAFLQDVCMRMNEAICDYIDKQQLHSSGATAAIVLFDKNDVHICNIGDSRIYRYRGGELTQISLSHCDESAVFGKPLLTQNLGIPETEFIIEPYIAAEPHFCRDIYMICSDGLTDMVSDGDISAILSQKRDMDDCAEELKRKALEAGGVDNITIVLCQVNRRKPGGFGIFRKLRKL